MTAQSNGETEGRTDLMPTYYVPVAVKAAASTDAELFVERSLRGCRPRDLPDAEVDWVGDAELQESDPGQFGYVELDPFPPDPDTGEYADGVVPLDWLPDGALFEDAEGRLFNVVQAGPVQGSVEIVDDEVIHAYYDCETRVRLHKVDAEASTSGSTPSP